MALQLEICRAPPPILMGLSCPCSPPHPTTDSSLPQYEAAGAGSLGDTGTLLAARSTSLASCQGALSWHNSWSQWNSFLHWLVSRSSCWQLHSLFHADPHTVLAAGAWQCCVTCLQLHPLSLWAGEPWGNFLCDVTYIWSMTTTSHPLFQRSGGLHVNTWVHLSSQHTLMRFWLCFWL